MAQTPSRAPSVILARRTADAPGLTVSNKYIAAEGPGARPSLYPWLSSGPLKGAVVLEPFKAASFSADEAATQDDGAEGVTRGVDSGVAVAMAAALPGGVAYAWTVHRPPDAQDKWELDLRGARRAALLRKGLSLEAVDKAEPLNDASTGLVRSFTAASGAEPLVHTFTELGVHVVRLEVTYAADGVKGAGQSKGAAFASKVATVEAKVVVKYVRRELHSVDDEDREALFDAWRVLLETEDSEGVDAYGDGFRSYARLAAEHNNLAGDRVCDHLHDGMGFVPAHVSVTRLFEASLQSVDPTVSLPYWEYTIDVEEVVAKHGGDFQHWRKMLAFTDKWFGDTRKDTGHVEGGTFAKFSLKANSFTSKTNSYGLIRAPWNNLKDDNFARFFGGGAGLGEAPTVFVDSDQMSTCSVLADTLARDTTLGSFNGGAAGQAHGPIHMFTGGQSGTPGLVEKMTSIGLKASSHIHNQMWGNGVTFFFANIKSLWRYGLWHCPDSCDASTAQEDCACGCDADEVMSSTARGDILQVYADTFESQGITLPGSDAVDGNATLALLVDLMCSFSKSGGIVMGDHASSGAASDPSFWVLHGAVERWLQLMRIQGRLTDESWDVPVFNSNIHPSSDSCSGHHETDTLVFGEVDGFSFTNGAYYDYLDPSGARLPYVYDNFEWKHCEALGVDITGRGAADSGPASGAASDAVKPIASGYPVPLTSGM